MTEAPLIIRGGQAIRPQEVERILLAHPGVAEAAVVGTPDRFWDEVVAAAVTLSAPLPSAVAELTAYCRGRLAPFKVPARWLLCAALPRTESGEVCRPTLTARLAAVYGSDGTRRDDTRPDGPVGFKGPVGFNGAVEFNGAGLDNAGFDAGGGLDWSLWTRPVVPSLRVPRQVRRSRALEDLDYL